MRSKAKQNLDLATRSPGQQAFDGLLIAPTLSCPDVKFLRHGTKHNRNVNRDKLRLNDVFMAPIGLVDTFYTFWRRSDASASDPVHWGWMSGQPHAAAGFPQVPPSHSVSVSCHGDASFTYMDEAGEVVADSWYVTNYHGSAYGLGSAGIALAASARAGSELGERVTPGPIDPALRDGFSAAPVPPTPVPVPFAQSAHPSIFFWFSRYFFFGTGADVPVLEGSWSHPKLTLPSPVNEEWVTSEHCLILVATGGEHGKDSIGLFDAGW